ncbi:hypothetical protein Zm00014a_040774 [Zea mays]|uniref:Uncharacterized protein n=1 Tax=Zea mays TaxID=4577 RepID=A0A3L6D7M7_MAIZE|nr:hypothetical protein Zm00014a_040774 [Zea mays]
MQVCFEPLEPTSW